MSSTASSSALLLSGLALLISTYALLSIPSGASEPEPSPPVAATPSSSPTCRCDDPTLERELAELRDELARMRRNDAPTAVLPAAAAEPRATRLPPTERELAEALPGDQPLPKLSLFVDIPDGVRLSQNPDGTISAEATDPAASGEEYLVYVITETGETKGVLVRVP